MGPKEEEEEEEEIFEGYKKKKEKEKKSTKKMIEVEEMQQTGKPQVVYGTSSATSETGDPDAQEVDCGPAAYFIGSWTAYASKGVQCTPPIFASFQ